MTYNKVLYDPFVDRRQNFYVYDGEKKSRIKMQAASVAGFVLQKNLVKNPHTNQYTLAPHVPTLSVWIHNKYKVPLGENENFSKERVLAYGTGSLVTPKTILTAAHVVYTPNSNELDLEMIKGSYVVFDYFMEDADKCPNQFSENQVYTIKKVLLHSYCRGTGLWEDWALVKLDREVIGRVPLKLDHAPIQNSWELYMLGFPNGLPGKITGNATIMKNLQAGYFECKVDACGGNSGSPLCRFDTGEVVGILCEGNADYTIVADYGKKGIQRCVSNRIQPSEIKEYEKCQTISTLNTIKEYMDRWATGFKLKEMASLPTMQQPGLYIYGYCQNGSCTQFNEPLWTARGTGTFRLEEIRFRSMCITCESGIVKILDTGFYNCRYELDGEVKEPNEAVIRKQKTVTHTILKTLDQGVNFTWNFLKIKVTKI